MPLIIFLYCKFCINKETNENINCRHHTKWIFHVINAANKKIEVIALKSHKKNCVGKDISALASNILKTKKVWVLIQCSHRH